MSTGHGRLFYLAASVDVVLRVPEATPKTTWRGHGGYHDLSLYSDSENEKVKQSLRLRSVRARRFSAAPPVIPSLPSGNEAGHGLTDRAALDNVDPTRAAWTGCRVARAAALPVLGLHRDHIHPSPGGHTSIGTTVVEEVKGLWKKEPARVAAVVAGGITALASVFGVVVPETTVLEALAYVLPFLLGGEVVRAKVTPAP
jgi:hypothetical protein